MINIISTHFGDDFYIKALIRNLYEVKLLPQNKLYIINNSSQELIIEDKNIIILKFVTPFTGGLQHSVGLNLCIKKVLKKEGKGKILVLDSDVILKKNIDWNQFFLSQSKIFNATLAMEYGSRVLTHSCFMYFDGVKIGDIDFLDGSYNFGFDSGRLIGYNLSKKYKVNKLFGERQKRLRFGDFYLNCSVFHLTSASLSYMPSRVVKNSFNRLLGINLRKQIYLVMSDKFTISKSAKIKIYFVAIFSSFQLILKSKFNLLPRKYTN
jgi:hypothetical protein